MLSTPLLRQRQADLKRRMEAKRTLREQARAIERVRARGRLPYEDLLASLPKKRNRRTRQSIMPADVWRQQ